MDRERKCSASKQILTALLEVTVTVKRVQWFFLISKMSCLLWSEVYTILILVIISTTIPTFTYGIQIGWLSPMGPLLQKPSESWDPLTFMDISWMATALPLAAICGIPFFSIASDRFGRKICIIFVSLLSSISWIIKLMAFKSYVFILARVFAGLAAGGCFVVVPVYIKEISEDSWRGALTSLTMTVCKLGVIFVYVIGMLLSYKANQWIYLSIAGLHIILFCFMPESPNYLLKRGREKKAAKTIAWLRNLKRNDKIVLDEISKLKEEKRKFEEMPKISLIGIFRDRATFSALRMTLMLMAMQTLSGCFLLMNYASNVFSRAGTKWSPNALAILMGSLQLAGSFFTTISIEKFGRKIPLACSSLVVSICMATVATCFLLELNGNLLPVVAVCVCILAYGAGLAPVPMVVMAEVFTFQFRARMAGASMAFSFFCSSMTVLLYAPITNAFGPHVMFYAFSAVCLLGLVYTILWVPETRGKTLKQIQEFWQKEPLPTLV